MILENCETIIPTGIRQGIEQGQLWNCYSEGLKVKINEYEPLLRAFHADYVDEEGAYLFSGFIDRFGHTCSVGRVDLDLGSLIQEGQ